MPKRRVLATTLSLLWLSGCAVLNPPTPAPVTATAELKNARGQTVATATFFQVSDGVRVVLEARGLPPGLKGVHIHEVGRCDPPDFTTAGAHYNPMGRQHGLQNPAGPHAGDLPNITIAADGAGRLESMNTHVSLGASGNALLDADGSSIVIHAGPDDFKTDPAGNSGARIACGVVTRARRPGS